MKFVFFIHSAVSDWNHGNAHFLRGLMSALTRMGHGVVSYEPRGAWSVENLLRDHGVGPIVDFARAYPEIDVRSYDPQSPSLSDDLAEAVAGADLVLVHEWNDPHVVNALPALVRAAGGIPLFHDTHHRPAASPSPSPASTCRRTTACWRSATCCATCTASASAWSARGPFTRPRTSCASSRWTCRSPRTSSGSATGATRSARRSCATTGWAPRGAFPSCRSRRTASAIPSTRWRSWRRRAWSSAAGRRPCTVPEAFARSRVTLHVPRRAYVQALRGIPTIRVFEALACGIPLVSAPWLDSESLFAPGDYVSVDSPEAMWEALHRFATDDDARAEQAERGLRDHPGAAHVRSPGGAASGDRRRSSGRSGAAGALAGGNREQGIGNSLQQQTDPLASEAACT